MDMTDTDTEYLQVPHELGIQDEAFARIEEDLSVAGLDLTYLDCSGLCVEGVTDLSGTTVTGSIDMENHLAHGGIDADGVTAHQVDATGAMTVEAPFLLRDTSMRTLRARNAEFGTLDLSGASMETADLRGAALQELVLDDTTTEEVDLRGSAVRSIDADTVDRYDILVDAATYLHDVPEPLADDLGYARLTAYEEETVWKLNHLYADGFEPVPYDAVRDAIMDAPQVNGVLSSLQRKGLVDRGEEGYRPTDRGMHVWDVGHVEDGHTAMDADAYDEWLMEHV